MLHFIDISNWQAGLSVHALSGIDAVIMKATGGTGYVDPYCDPWVQEAIQRGLPWGFYHFANDWGYADAADEARFFIDNCRGYFGHGIPVLDWEVDVGPDWVNQFVRMVHDETGVWPWVYANGWRIDQGGVEPNCGRWLANYPSWILNPLVPFDPGEPPEVDGLLCAWQYASDGMCQGYWGDLDVNVFYGDTAAWNAYAGATTTTPAKPIQDSVDKTQLKKGTYTLKLNGNAELTLQ
jgi:GH25 family lysozyme M1 (1,4-beta-N-acetylmuramidase)